MSDYTPQHAPLSPWAYFGLQILFSVPIVGLVFLIVFSFSNANINRRNFARSFFCVYIVVAIVATILVLTGGFAGLLSMLSQY